MKAGATFGADIHMVLLGASGKAMTERAGDRSMKWQ